MSTLPRLEADFRTDPKGYHVYARDPETWRARGCSRERPVSSAPHRRPRERHLTGNVSYDPSNHEQMVGARAAKWRGIAKDFR